MVEIVHRQLSYAVVGAAMEVHGTLGSGFLESVYQAALCHELGCRGITYEAAKLLTVRYKGVVVGNYEADIVVDDKIILELKAVKKIHRRHMAQTRHYLTATGFRLGLVLNFGGSSLQHKRVVN
ncbi:MAG TPA: GxxExxY protein [Candidatus Sulfomarinibacteraceae bacterium]|nr:GxxExxY protein [Candidatus Sulfomarinibacteraceae bacterium]